MSMIANGIQQYSLCTFIVKRLPSACARRMVATGLDGVALVSWEDQRLDSCFFSHQGQPKSQSGDGEDQAV